MFHNKYDFFLCLKRMCYAIPDGISYLYSSMLKMNLLISSIIIIVCVLYVMSMIKLTF